MREELKSRTKEFAISIINMTEKLPKKTAAYITAKQLIRSATSVGANYRAALRGRSKAEFIAKIGIVEEEADETMYWLELIVGTHLLDKEAIVPLWKEANELTAIFTSMGKTSKQNRKK
jgi:four helix bundle protein